MKQKKLDCNQHWVRGKDAISYSNGVESLCAHCDREDVLSLVEASQAADHWLQLGDKDEGDHPTNNEGVLSSKSLQDQNSLKKPDLTTELLSKIVQPS